MLILTFLFLILMVVLLAKLIFVAVSCAWGIIKVIGLVIIAPLIIIGLAVSGLFIIAIPLAIAACIGCFLFC